MAIKKYKDGSEYCDGFKDFECFEEILLDFEIKQGFCIRCQKLKDDDACEAE